MKLQGHHGEVWALAIAKHGSFVVTGSHDRSIRIWEKTDEQVIFLSSHQIDCMVYLLMHGNIV